MSSGLGFRPETQSRREAGTCLGEEGVQAYGCRDASGRAGRARRDRAEGCVPKQRPMRLGVAGCNHVFGGGVIQPPLLVAPV